MSADTAQPELSARKSPELEGNEIPLGQRDRRYRFFEMLPAIFSYGALAAVIVLSLINPTWGAIFVLAVVAYMFIKGVRGAFDLVRGLRRFRRSARVDWNARLLDIALTMDGRRVPPTPPGSFRADEHRRLLDDVREHPEKYPHPARVQHAIVIAAYNEPYEVIEPTIRGLLYTTTPSDHLHIFFAYEERGGPDMQLTAQRLQEKYGRKFGTYELVQHPRDIPGEITGKGGNITHAGRRVQAWAEERGYDASEVIVTTLDCDNKPYESYFDYTAYEYIRTEDRKHSSFQPIALYLSNIWDAPAITRVIASANCFFNLTQTVRTFSLRNFASHSQPLDALIEMDFWSTRTIVEDGHQFWRSYFHFSGRYRVIPIHVPIYQDAVLAGNLRQSITAQFKQLSRWSYGASDVPYVTKAWANSHPKPPFFRTLCQFILLVESHVTLACVSIIIAVGGWVPVLALRATKESAPAFTGNMPFLVGTIQQVAMLMLLVSLVVFVNLLPPRPVRYSRRRSVSMLAQWLLFPFTLMIFNSSTALVSQGRLLVGRYRENFEVTQKTVVKSNVEPSARQIGLQRMDIENDGR